MPPSRSLDGPNPRHTSGENKPQSANRHSGREKEETVQVEPGQDRQAVEGHAAHPQQQVHNQPAQSNNRTNPPVSKNAQRETSSHSGGAAVSNTQRTGHQTILPQRSGPETGNQRHQNTNERSHSETGHGNGSNAAREARRDKTKRVGRVGGAGIYLIPRHREKPFLPEPALTASLPKESKQSTPAEDNSHLSMLAAVAEEYDRRQRPEHEGTILPFSGQRGNEHDSENPAGNTETRILPSFLGPRDAISAQDQNPINLPPVKQVIRNMRDQSFRAMNDEQWATFRREWEALRQERLAEENSGRTSTVGPQEGSKNASQNGNDREPGQSAAINQNIPGGANARAVTKKNGTARTVNMRRLRDRGHNDGFVSFGEYVQADMPSPSLSHFSIMKRPRTAYHQSTDIRVIGRPDDGPPFNIFQAILRRPELVITLARHIRVQELLTLYSTCRPFHEIVKLRLTTVVVTQALVRASKSAEIFPFRCYGRLCVEDPAKRPHPVAEKAAAGEFRKVPSFCWLRMVCFREMVCHEIMTIMAEDGVPLPDACESVMKKIWFLMDLPDNQRRIGMIQNREIFTDSDIFFATLFFVKMDMRFTDPLTGSGKDGMRRLLMAQPSISTFWRTLKRTALISKLDVIKLFVRWKYQPRPAEASHGLLGVPPSEIGIMQYEAWGRSGSQVPLQRPDELVLLESIRRDLKLDEKYTDMFLWGYVNPNTMENFPPVVRRRNLARLEGWEEDLIPSEDKDKLAVPKRVSTRVLQN